MPSRLASTGSFRTTGNFNRSRELDEAQRARQVSVRERVNTQGPWQGYTPDLPHAILDYTYCKDEPSGLIAAPDPNTSHGEVLTLDDGFSAVDSGGISGHTDYDGNSSGIICRLDTFHMRSAAGVKTATQNDQLLALTAGNASDAGSFQLWQLDPNTAAWEEISFVAGGGAEPSAGIDGDSTASVMSMPDSCEFPRGIPAGGARPGLEGTIDRNCWIFTNNYDNVQVFPDATLGTSHVDLGYQDLQTDEFGTNFRAISCETFGDRVYFLNTYETTTRYPGRLRRTARSTADTLSTSVGAGKIDLENFAGQGLRIEKLGDVLVCYFEDGTAFITETGLSTSPNEVNILDERRGLLGTHAVIPIGGTGHFGIFTDGWWILDTNGNWTALGRVQSEDKTYTKFIDTFYNTLSYEHRHRIQMGYDPVRNFVRISQPVKGTSGPTFKVWIYDINSDRVWIDNYGAGPTCWGTAPIPTSTSDKWSDVSVPGDTWDDVGPTPNLGLTSWAASEAEIGIEVPVHGTNGTEVYQHLRSGPDRSSKTFSYPSASSDFGNFRSLKTANRVDIEYVNTENPNNFSVQVFDGRNKPDGSDTTSMDQGNSLGAIERATAWFRKTGERLGVRISGAGEVMIRSFELEYLDEDNERIL